MTISTAQTLLKKQGRKFSLMLNASLTGRDYIHDEEKEMIPFFIEALQARLSEIQQGGN